MVAEQQVSVIAKIFFVNGVRDNVSELLRQFYFSYRRWFFSLPKLLTVHVGLKRKQQMQYEPGFKKRTKHGHYSSGTQKFYF